MINDFMFLWANPCSLEPKSLLKNSIAPKRSSMAVPDSLDVNIIGCLRTGKVLPLIQSQEAAGIPSRQGRWSSFPCLDMRKSSPAGAKKGELKAPSLGLRQSQEGNKELLPWPLSEAKSGSLAALSRQWPEPRFLRLLPTSVPKESRSPPPIKYSAAP